jgi:parallel beta-helix repeat protein
MKNFLFIGFLLSLAQPNWATEYHVSVSGSDRNPGTRVKPFRSISRAVKKANAGDIITVHAGIYRELVSPITGGTFNEPITYRAAPNEKVEIRGSEQVNNWILESPGVWKLVLPNSYFGNYNPYTDLIYGDWFFPLKRRLHTGEVYLNGQALYEAPSMANVKNAKPEALPVSTPNALTPDHTWYTEQKDGQTIIYARFQNFDPNEDLIEINVRSACFYPPTTGVNYITVQGFTMKQAATQWAAPTAEQVGIIGTNWSKGWIIENNTISDSKCVGVTLGKDRASGQNLWSADMSKEGSDLYNEMIRLVAARDWNKSNIGSHIVRNNTIYNCGAAGICGSLGAIYSQIRDNHIYDIYTRRNYYGAEMAGIKIHGAIDVIIKGNNVSNAFIGLWLDWMAQGTQIISNTFSDNDYVDFFSEVNHGPYSFDNNIMLSEMAFRDWSEGGTFTHNLFGGKLSRAPQDRQTPYFKMHSTEIIGINKISGGKDRFTSNYFLIDDQEPKVPLMHPWDKPDSLQSYGLSLYQGATLPVIQDGNFMIRRNTISKIIKQQFSTIP